MFGLVGRFLRLYDRFLLLVWEIYIEIRYKSYDGFFASEVGSGFKYTKKRAWISLGYKVDIENPRTFNEKLISRRLFSRHSVWPKVTDKIAVRHWLIEKNFTRKVSLIPAAEYTKLEELALYQVDHPVVVKAAWASGRNIFVNSQEDLNESIPTLKKWLKEPYKVSTLIWASGQNPRKFIVEDKLSTSRGDVPVDYKFFIFNGKVKFIQVDLGRFVRHTRALFDRNGSRLPHTFSSYESAPVEYSLPEYVTSKMVNVAEELGHDFSFVRVDLYWFAGKVYFGELTQTPSAGFGKLSSNKFDRELGELWSDFDKSGL